MDAQSLVREHARSRAGTRQRDFAQRVQCRTNLRQVYSGADPDHHSQRFLTHPITC